MGGCLGWFVLEECVNFGEGESRRGGIEDLHCEGVCGEREESARGKTCYYLSWRMTG